MQKKFYTHKAPRRGFTLIEILIVVAIISVLASMVLVGIGPTQQSGRDARRLSDIRGVQTALELYYAKCGYYPGAAAAPCPITWTASKYADLYGTNGANGVIGSSGIGVSNMPTDPSANGHYWYATDNGGTTYILAVKLENQNNSAFVNYNPPSLTTYTNGDTITSCSSPYYCITL